MGCHSTFLKSVQFWYFSWTLLVFFFHEKKELKFPSNQSHAFILILKTNQFINCVYLCVGGDPDSCFILFLLSRSICSSISRNTSIKALNWNIYEDCQCFQTWKKHMFYLKKTQKIQPLKKELNAKCNFKLWLQILYRKAFIYVLHYNTSKSQLDVERSVVHWFRCVLVEFESAYSTTLFIIKLMNCGDDMFRWSDIEMQRTLFLKMNHHKESTIIVRKSGAYFAKNKCRRSTANWRQSVRRKKTKSTKLRGKFKMESQMTKSKAHTHQTNELQWSYSWLGKTVFLCRKDELNLVSKQH